MAEFNLLHAEALYVRFCAIYGDKFFKSYHDSDFKKIWNEEWVSGLKGIDVMFIKEVLEYCKSNMEWPPSIAEFRSVCENKSGIPSQSECFDAAIRGDFYHPIIDITYQKVGSWAMKNDKSADLQSKFGKAYVEALNQFRVNPSQLFNRIELSNEVKSIPLIESTIHPEMSIKDHPAWKIENVTVGSKKFDKIIYNKRYQYLTSLDEKSSETLNQDDWYDRIRYLRQMEANSAIKNNNQCSGIPIKEKTNHRHYNGSRSVFDKWND